MGLDHHRLLHLPFTVIAVKFAVRVVECGRLHVPIFDKYAPLSSATLTVP